MIYKTKLAELPRHSYDLDDTDWDDIKDALRKLFAVYEAAEKVKANHDWVMEDPTGRSCGIGCDMGEAGPGKHGEHDPDCRIWAVVKALAEFRGAREK